MTLLTAGGHVRGLRHSEVMARAIETGGDSVSPSGIPQGLDVYVGYTAGAPGYRSGGFSNMPAIKSTFPGKRYISVGTSAIDIEPGLASVTDARAFVENWQPDGLVSLPIVYASQSNMSAIMNNLAGVTRPHALWVAAWDGVPALPPGYLGKQWANHPGYDADSFDSSIFSGAAPSPTPTPTPTPTGQEWPLMIGSPFPADVRTLQGNLNRWASTIGLSPVLVVDGNYGGKTAAAVTLALQHFHVAGVPAGDCPQSLFNALKGNPTPTPAPVPTPTPTPTGTIDIDGYLIGKPDSTAVPCVISWNGYAGLTRRVASVPNSVWQQISWVINPVHAPNPSPAPIPTPAPAPTPTPTPGGGGGGSVYPGPSQAVAAPFATINGEIIYGYLRQHGYTPVAAAGATASMWGEGEWSPEVAGSGGWGLMGWTGNYPDSRTGNAPADMAKQLPMILQFVQQFGDTVAVASMQHVSTVLEAANIWGVQVERFGINDVHPQGIAAVQAIALKLDGVRLP